jgi:hypothetical protein
MSIIDILKAFPDPLKCDAVYLRVFRNSRVYRFSLSVNFTDITDSWLLRKTTLAKYNCVHPHETPRSYNHHSHSTVLPRTQIKYALESNQSRTGGSIPNHVHFHLE